MDLLDPVVMGIVNITPDSFYAGSRVKLIDEILAKVSTMISEGSAIIDLGAMSTRPGASEISAEQEIERLKPVLSEIIKTFPDQIISVDTVWSTVARWALEQGVHMINDISAWSIDPEIFNVVVEYKVPYVLMHMKGTPTNMQQNAKYENVVLEVLDFLIAKVGQLAEAELHDVIVDPGFGFAKTSEHNFDLLQNLHAFRILEKPIMAGLSRKSTIQKTLNVSADKALNGTTALNMVALQQGAHILRVHDVKEAVECIKLYKELKKYDRTQWSDSSV